MLRLLYCWYEGYGWGHGGWSGVDRMSRVTTDIGSFEVGMTPNGLELVVGNFNGTGK